MSTVESTFKDPHLLYYILQQVYLVDKSRLDLIYDNHRELIADTLEHTAVTNYMSFNQVAELTWE